MTKIFLVRHCEATGNTSGKLQGRTDCDVSGNSAEQLKLVSNRLRGEPFAAIYSSPLKRAFKTAQAINQYHHLKIQTDDRLTEIDMGNWEGRSWESIEKENPPLLEVWKENIGEFAAENGESIRQVGDRMWSAVTDIVKANRGETVCITSHGCAIRTFLCRALGKPLGKLNDIPWSDNTAVSIIEFSDGLKPKVLLMNDASHIPPSLSVYRRDTGIMPTNLDKDGRI